MWSIVERRVITGGELSPFIAHLTSGLLTAPWV